MCVCECVCVHVCFPALQPMATPDLNSTSTASFSFTNVLPGKLLGTCMCVRMYIILCVCYMYKCVCVCVCVCV